jgi:hypothetical protein
MIVDAVPKFYLRSFLVPGPAYFVGVVYFLSCLLYGHYELFKAYSSSTGLRRNQLAYLFWSSLFGYIGGAVNFLFVFNINIPVVSTFGTYTIPIYVAATTYAIVRYRFMDIQTVIHKTAMWIATSSLIILPFGGLFYLGRDWIAGLSPFHEFILLAGVIVFLIPYIKVVQPRIDHFFQRRKHDLQKIIQDFMHEIAALKSLDELVSKLQNTISSVLYPEQTSIILLDDEAGTLKPFKLKGLPEGFVISNHAAFLNWLERTSQIVERDQSRRTRSMGRPEKSLKAISLRCKGS